LYVSSPFQLQEHKTFFAAASPHITRELNPEITLRLYANKAKKKNMLLKIGELSPPWKRTFPVALKNIQKPSLIFVWKTEHGFWVFDVISLTSEVRT
jgi:hypothetical protein